MERLYNPELYNRDARFRGNYADMSDSYDESSSEEEYGNLSRRRFKKRGMMKEKNKNSNSLFANQDDEEAVLALQQDMVDAVSGKIRELSCLQKGNYGEAKANIRFSGANRKRISRNPVVTLNQSTHQGIDLVVSEKNGENTVYYIIEAKVGSSRLSILPDGTRQMSWDWILPRLKDAVGEELAEQIELAARGNVVNVVRVVYHVDLDGNSETEILEDDW